MIEQEDLVIPAGIDSLAAFRRWAFSDEFPENGRIDYLAGTIDADFSLEKLEGSYREMEHDSRGRLASPLLGFSSRLLRHLTPVGTFRYQLEHGGT
ncbi:MAG TPA: hypothetical protein VHQ90_03650 [Thermoanaerobaculia bacterium]|nr:hypothetical protein [Thermoanaerobaculia bacterium]